MLLRDALELGAPLLSFQGTTPLGRERQLLCLGPRVKKGLWGAEQSRGFLKGLRPFQA